MQNNQGNNQPSFYNQPTQTGQYPPPPPPYAGQFYNQPPVPPAQPRPYSKNTLMAFIGFYSAFWIFGFISGAASSNAFATFLGRVGISLLWGILASVLIMDWHGYTTIDGLVKWQQMRKSRRFWMWCVHIFLCMFVLGVYLTRKALSYLRSSHQVSGTQWQVVPKSRKHRTGVIAGTVIALLAFVAYSSSATSSVSTTTVSTTAPVVNTSPTSIVDSQPSDTPTDEPTQVTLKATSVPTIVPTRAPVATQAPLATPIPTQPPAPTPVPTRAPVPTKAPAPTPVPTQPPATGLNGNPYGYNLTAPGNLIYSPPSDICNYFDCIASFWNNTNGYVDECVDGMYSHSGGVRGACSRHGGEAQPLYSH